MRVLVALLSLFVAPLAFAQASDDQFIAQLNIDALKPISIQHNQTLKTLDSFARQTVTAITGKGSYQSRPAVYTVLDMTYRPEAYFTLNIIKIKNTALRQDFLLLTNIDQKEKDRIIKEGTISLKFWQDPEVQQLMEQVQANAVFKAQAIGQVHEAAMSLAALSAPMATPYHVFPPATHADHLWKCLPDLMGQTMDGHPPTAASGVSPMAAYAAHADALQASMKAWTQLGDAWRARDAAQANDAIAALETNLPAVSPEVYPSHAKRKAEVIYNGLSQLTKPGIMLYFVSLVLFLIAAQSGKAGMRLWALRVMIVAFLVHTAGIGIRWWLVEKSVGNWFESIPIKNMFESVMFSAWFGTLIGLILEIRNRRGLFGAAASFVGTASMVALLTVPYFYRDIGGEISQVQGVLMSYWLYIHVTMVVASYALIGMAFLLSCWWLWGYYKEYGTFSRMANPHKLSADAAGKSHLQATGDGAIVAPTLLAQLLFLARPKEAVIERVQTDADAPQFQAELDACNLVMLHLIFWILGVGIILGAVWADMSWGRPWGWDPKETFALVTWIVYLIIIHVRVIANDKAWWTAVLSIIGFFIMLFNWIGVNFFLTGLHSYAG